MAEPFIGEIALFPYTRSPVHNWHLCDGTLLSISTNAALYSLIGTTYGGDGTTNFALPKLDARCVIGSGQGQGLTPRVQGAYGGSETVTLTLDEVPGHIHGVRAADVEGDKSSPSNTRLLAKGSVDNRGTAIPVDTYDTTHDTTMSNGAITPTGGGLPHNNMQPFTVMAYYIAISGIYPPRP